MLKAVICDFDGTLVETFEANLLAYIDAFRSTGAGELTSSLYKACYGLRFDDFMDKMGILDPSVRDIIRKVKAQRYPFYLDHIKVNSTLLNLVSALRRGGVKTAIASTARRENLMAVVNRTGIEPCFDYILTAEDSVKAKPDPEIYLRAMDHLGVMAEETIIFEDTEVGIAAAVSSGVRAVRVTEEWFV